MRLVTRISLTTGAALALAALLSTPAYAAGSQPAGGAATGQIVIATTAATIVTAVLLWLGTGHRSGRVPVLRELAAFSSRVSGLPGWAALPAGLASGSLLTAVFGMYWDISLHIGVGRDPGPLANPAHYFILAGLFGIFAAGFLAMVLPQEKPSASAIRITRDWHAPLGGVLICACGAFSLIGFPLDDMWHRLFGQDVTLWGPTHLMLIGGAAMTLVGIAVLLVEAVRANRSAGSGRELGWTFAARRVALSGGLLAGLSTFQGEFDFGVPQFRFIFAPMLVMLAASVALVATRIWLGRGSALGAAGFFLLIRGGLALLVGPVLGEPTPHFPLYIVAALVVEGVALVVARERVLAFALWCGVGIGTLGLAAEWGWTHVWSAIPWPSALFPEGAILGFAMAIAGALVGAWVGARLASDKIARPAAMRPAAVLGAATIAALVVFALHKPTETGIRAQVTLTDVRSGPDRTVDATVKITPASAARDAEWLTATAWQGGGLVVDRLKPTGPGTYRTTVPIPVHGDWKALIRLHKGPSLAAVPLYLPEDKAIPAKGVPANERFTRTFVADHKILQREQKTSAGLLTALAYAVVAAIALALLGLLAWGLHRLGAAATGPDAAPSRRRQRSRDPKIAPRSATPAVR